MTRALIKKKIKFDTRLCQFACVSRACVSLYSVCFPFVCLYTYMCTVSCSLAPWCHRLGNKVSPPLAIYLSLYTYIRTLLFRLPARACFSSKHAFTKEQMAQCEAIWILSLPESSQSDPYSSEQAWSKDTDAAWQQTHNMEQSAHKSEPDHAT